MRETACGIIMVGLVILTSLSDFSPAQEKTSPKHKLAPHIVFVTGDCEYRSEITMPMIAKILETHHGMKCTICYAVDERTGEIKPKHLTNISGLEALATADLAVFYIRYRQLPEEQLKLILDYIHSGKPIVGLRTSTHAFRYPPGIHAKWNDDFGRLVFGQKWLRHHGHNSSTLVYLTLKDHPISRGVALEFHVRSWLYHVMPLEGDCTILANGIAVRGEPPSKDVFGTPNPVAWTKHYGKARVFFTTLGHPKDFEVESVRKLLINGIYWALGWEEKIPSTGCQADIVGTYIAPPTTQAIPDPLLIPSALTVP
ncbi:MAG: ThuA domain-containing protein [Gemmatales bacterium]|nr:ThuA domain-containing protein [Gemmatales bacterium]MDW7994204.1 ThuA domain-containing protein [Gemmatales bacterium]